MKREFFNQQFAALVNAYTISRQLADESQDVYWEMLKDIPDAKFAEGVKECLATSKFFPTIAELGDASLPPVIDRSAGLPPVDRPWPLLNWREQLREVEKEREQKAITEARSARCILPEPEGANELTHYKWPQRDGITVYCTEEEAKKIGAEINVKRRG